MSLDVGEVFLCGFWHEESHELKRDTLRSWFPEMLWLENQPFSAHFSAACGRVGSTEKGISFGSKAPSGTEYKVLIKGQ